MFARYLRRQLRRPVYFILYVLLRINNSAETVITLALMAASGVLMFRHRDAVGACIGRIKDIPILEMFPDWVYWGILIFLACYLIGTLVMYIVRPLTNKVREMIAGIFYRINAADEEDEAKDWYRETYGKEWTGREENVRTSDNDMGIAMRAFGLSPGFSREELNKRYKEKAKQYHPDSGGNNDMMIQTNKYYEMLKPLATKKRSG